MADLPLPDPNDTAADDVDGAVTPPAVRSPIDGEQDGAPDRRPATRRRLLEAANQRFRDHGYDAATAAAIAADAGVTERTFFRYFPTKADVLVANWERHGESMRRSLDAHPAGEVASDAALADVVHDALRSFLRGVSDELDAGLDSVVRIYTNRTAFLAIIEHLLGVEQELAEAVALRCGRPADDFRIRVAANASMGVLRAAVRAAVLFPDGPRMLDLLDAGMGDVVPLFDGLWRDTHPSP